MKKYIWGFPGIGKSNINNDKIVDADCEKFKYIFPDGVPDNLHKSDEWEDVLLNHEYPENYLKYVESLDAEIVLLNCHVGLLERFDKENVLLVYPCAELITEYLERYKHRGDNESFVSYMAAEFDGMIQHIDYSDYKKYKVFGENTYLSDLFERNDFKVKVMTRKELTEQLQRAIDLNVLDVNFDGDIVCDISLATKANFSSQVYNASELADAVLNGGYGLDIEQLLMVCLKREAEIEKEKVMLERRGGLSREELEDKIMQGIVNGALGIRHGEIAPYSHGYLVAFGSENDVGSTHNAIKSWYCYCDLFEIPGKIAEKIENDESSFDIHKMIKSIDEMEDKQIASFVPEKDTNLKRSNYPHSLGSVASVMDVHAGKGLDGIVKHHYHGTWSNYTTVLHNELVESLVFLKGFCLDCFYEENLRHPNGIRSESCKGIIEYLKKHGTDITTPEKVNEWIKANPEKCGKEENRQLFELKQQKEIFGRAYNDVVKLNALVSEFKGTIDELCTKLGGHNFDGELFDVNYGVLTATINLKDGKLSLNQKSIDVWDDNLTNMVKECIPVIELKAICKQLGVEVNEFNDVQNLYAQAYCDFVELKAVVDSYQHSYPCAFEKLCRDLGGDRYDDNTFRLEYGALALSIGRDFNNEIFLCESAIGVWDAVREDFVNDCISLKELKATCEEIGFSIDSLEAKALDKSKDRLSSLDEQIGKSEAQKETADSISKALERGEFR